jgi:hypothetical protein
MVQIKQSPMLLPIRDVLVVKTDSILKGKRAQHSYVSIRETTELSKLSNIS